MSEQSGASATAVQLSFNFERVEALEEHAPSKICLMKGASVAYLSPKRELQARRQELDAYTRVMEYAQSLRRL